MRTPAAGRGSMLPRPPAAGQPQQWIVLRPWAFDVIAAIWLLRATPRPAQPLPVMAWARAYGLLPAPGGGPHTVPLIGPKAVRLGREYLPCLVLNAAETLAIRHDAIPGPPRTPARDRWRRENQP